VCVRWGGDKHLCSGCRVNGSGDVKPEGGKCVGVGVGVGVGAREWGWDTRLRSAGLSWPTAVAATTCLPQLQTSHHIAPYQTAAVLPFCQLPAQRSMRPAHMEQQAAGCLHPPVSCHTSRATNYTTMLATNKRLLRFGCSHSPA
jgi:hypothetical protein